MRVPYVSVLASIAVAVACATGADVSDVHVQAIDAGLTVTPSDMGGAGGTAMTRGGAVGAGGDGSGNVGQGDGGSTSSSSGGTTTVESGGTTSSGGTSAAGGKSSGGGGVTASGGTTTSAAGTAGKGTGGSTGTAGMSGDAGSCMMGQKFCGGLCTPPAPRVGCGLTGCDACTITPPQNGYITCANNQCVFDCLSGYTKMGNSCIGSGAGGGSSGNCNISKCPVCNVVSGPACCTNQGKCGCPAIPYVPPTCATPL
jgi:hypothetical protein